MCGACVGGYGRGVTWAEAQPAMTMSCRPGLLQKSFGTILEELDLGGGMPSIAFRRREVLTCGADGRGVKRAGGGRREAGRGGVFDAWASVRAGRDRE